MVSAIHVSHFGPRETPERQAMRKARIEANLGLLSEPERARFRELTVEVSGCGAFRLDWLAASLLAGRALRPFATGLLGRALVQAVTGGQRRQRLSESLEWVVRLNSVDWAETRVGIWSGS